jgi:hypothetical protein
MTKEDNVYNQGFSSVEKFKGWLSEMYGRAGYGNLTPGEIDKIAERVKLMMDDQIVSFERDDLGELIDEGYDEDDKKILHEHFEEVASHVLQDEYVGVHGDEVLDSLEAFLRKFKEGTT